MLQSSETPPAIQGRGRFRGRALRVLPVTLRSVERIFVGDVQGCAREWERLVARARNRLGAECEIWQVGDLVNKGPENVRCLERMRREVEAGRGFFVLGNHEVHLMRVLAGIEPLYPGDSLGDVVGSREAPEWLEWLRHRPLVEVFSIGETPGLMVHAAVHPGWTRSTCEARGAKVAAALSSDESEDWLNLLERSRSAEDAGSNAGVRDDLARFTTCRSVHRNEPDRWERHPPTSPWTAWHAAWRIEKHDYGIVYGHWAERGLLVAPGLRGLDSGCVYAGLEASGKACLTGWRPDFRRSDPETGQTPFDCPDDDFLTEKPEAPYLSGEEPYSFQPRPRRSGIVARHGESRGAVRSHGEAEIAVVSGLPRSGTSMLMQMLRAGGIDVLSDGKRVPDDDNPRGYLEWDAVKRIREDVSWVPQATGRAVKVVAPLLRELPDRHRYAIVFCQRDLEEVVASQAAMLIRGGRSEETARDDSLGPLLEREVSRATRWLERAAHVRVLFLDHVEIIRDPLDAAVRIDSFLGGGLDAQAMSREVDPDLYRHRTQAIDS